MSGKGNLPRTCRQHGIPVSQVNSLAEAGDLLRRGNAAIVLCSVPRRVPLECLASVPGGWINTHCGPLPDYRGLDAPFWCLHNGEANLAVTLHYMAEDFDTGPIAAQRKLANTGEPYFAMVGKLFDVALEMHLEFVRTGRPTFAEATPQDASKGRYFGRPDASLGQEFRRRGGRFV
jgi:methionyl-tRNA formyltransferase